MIGAWACTGPSPIALFLAVLTVLWQNERSKTNTTSTAVLKLCSQERRFEYVEELGLPGHEEMHSPTENTNGTSNR
eukprot:5105377-Amphidinium_carterae.1